MKKNPASSDITPRQSRSNVVPLKGEIDLHVSPTVTAALNDVIDKKPGRLVVDLSEVSYIDSAGLAALIQAMQKRGRLRRQIHAGRIAGNCALDLRNLAARSGLSDFPGRGCRAGWLAIRVTRSDGFPAVKLKSTAAQAVVPWRTCATRIRVSKSQAFAQHSSKYRNVMRVRC